MFFQSRFRFLTKLIDFLYIFLYDIQYTIYYSINTNTYQRIKMSYPILTPIPSNYRRALIFDVETTGLIAKPNPANATPPRLHECPYIIQLSFIIVDLQSNRVEEAFDAYVSIPEEVEIVERITEITGITREKIRTSGEPIVSVMEEFYSAYIKCDIIVAHNLEFDSSMVAIEVARNKDVIRCGSARNGLCPFVSMSSLFTPALNSQYNISMYCTMRASIELCSIMTDYTPREATTTVIGPNEFGVITHTRSSSAKPKQFKKFPRLSELHETLFGNTPENLHNSLIDVLVCMRCFMKIRCCVNIPDAIFERTVRTVVRKTTGVALVSVLGSSKTTH